MGTLSASFAPYAETVAIRLLGRPTRRSRSEIRWGKKGSLALSISGPRTGHFHDYEQSAGGDLVDLVRRELNMPAHDAFRWLADMTGALPLPPMTNTTKAISERQGQQRWSGKAEHIWDRSRPLGGTLGQRYLESRKCYVPEVTDLRYLGGDDRYPPAVVGRVTDFRTGSPMSLTFIRLEAATGRKHSKGNLRGHLVAGGAVRLLPRVSIAQPLGLAEGIETALSIIAERKEPVWATLGVGNMAKLSPDSRYPEVNLWADNNDAGHMAAYDFAYPWTADGHVVRIICPSEAFGDWNDVVCGKRRDGSDVYS
jgi:hypothetical protein